MAAVDPLPAADDFAGRIAEAQRQLAESATRAGLKRDPYHHLIEAQSVVIGVFPELVQRMEASRQPVQNEQLRVAVIQGIRSYAGEAIKAANWRNVLIGVGILVVTTSIGWAGGYFYNAAAADAKIAAARQQTIIVGDTIKTALSGPAAQTWGWLIQTNGDNILTAQTNCVDTKDGGRACNYALWARPPTPPPVAPQQGQGQSSTQRAAR